MPNRCALLMNPPTPSESLVRYGSTRETIGNPPEGRKGDALLTDVVFLDGEGRKIRIAPVLEIYRGHITWWWSAFVQYPGGAERWLKGFSTMRTCREAFGLLVELARRSGWRRA